MSGPTVFLLSPAHCGGKRAGYLFNPGAGFALARRMHDDGGIPLGEAFCFMSGLYFRGKLAYANRFAAPPPGVSGTYVITTNRGLVPPAQIVSAADLQSMGVAKIKPDDPLYRSPLQRDLQALIDRSGDCHVVLLGSIATGKYVDVLLEMLGQRLLFPADFVGRGDMSRGGLMLRCVAGGNELSYVPVAGAMRTGSRPVRLERPPPPRPAKRRERRRSRAASKS
jgi:hypothetical protein